MGEDISNGMESHFHADKAIANRFDSLDIVYAERDILQLKSHMGVDGVLWWIVRKFDYIEGLDPAVRLFCFPMRDRQCNRDRW